MSSNVLVMVPLMGVCQLLGQIVPAPPIRPLEPASPSIQRNPFEAVPEASEAPRPKISGPIIEAIEFRNTRGVPQLILRVIIATRAGDAYDPENLRRDSQALYHTGRFSNIAWETEPGRKGVIVRFTVVERPLLQSIEYQGEDSVTISEILERFEQRKIKLRAETLFDEKELGGAVATVRELAAEKGRQNITVTPLVEPISPTSAVKITFRVAETQ